MKPLLDLVKWFFIVLVLGTVLSLVLSCLYNLLYPVIPDVIIQKLSSYFWYDTLFYREQKPVYYNLGELVFVLSFFVISFKAFPGRNTLTKIIFACLFLVGGAVIVGHMNSNFLYILFLAVPPLLALYFLISRRKPREKPNPLQKFVSYDTKKEGIYLPTTQGDVHIKNLYRGISIQGGAGSGKSETFFKPILGEAARQGLTGMLYDFKSPELTKTALKAYNLLPGIATFNVDFRSPETSDRVNPLNPRYLLKQAYIQEYSLILINNLMPETVKQGDMNFWAGNARMILAGLAWYFKKHYPQFCTIPHVVASVLYGDFSKITEKLNQDNEAGGMLSSLRESLEREASDQTAGVLSTLKIAVSKINDPEIYWILSGNDFSLHLNDPQNPAFLCLGNDSTLFQTYAPPIALIMEVALRQMNQPGQAKSMVCVDELPTIYLPNFPHIPATARSNKIATVVGFQDYSQLVDSYGETKTENILSNLGTQIYGRTVNVKSAQMVVDLFSKEDRTYKTASRGTGTSGQLVHMQSNRNQGTAESIQERDRVKVSDIVNLRPGEFYGIVSEGQPREFLKTQFLLAEETEVIHNPKPRTTPQEMQNNFDNIIQEVKQYFD